VISVNQALYWTEKLIAFNVLLQSVEFLLIQKKFSPERIWSWDILQNDFSFFPGFFQKFLRKIFSAPGFVYLAGIQILVSISVLFFTTSFLPLFLLLSSLLICWRWRGVFNGGSDSMTLLALLALAAARLHIGETKFEMGCLWFLALQGTASYFLAGLFKLKNPNWRSGSALGKILRAWSLPPALSWFGSWLILCFECFFPVVFVFPQTTPLFLGLGLLFHLMNIFAFGLNRFFWAWLAIYPALYYSIFSIH
jgi:hypothetical protein